jgi:hypothetical protein
MSDERQAINSSSFIISISGFLLRVCGASVVNLAWARALDRMRLIK